MTRFLLFIVFYVLAVAVGFALRTRYDAWMYGKPHMQARLRVFAQEVTLYDPDDPEAEEEDFYPPSTTDPLAFNQQQAIRAVRERQAELDQVFAQVAADLKAGDAGAVAATAAAAAPVDPAAIAAVAADPSQAPSGQAATVEPAVERPVRGYAEPGATSLVDPVDAALGIVDPLADGHYDPTASGGYRATGAPDAGGGVAGVDDSSGPVAPDGESVADTDAFARAAAALQAGETGAVAPPLAAPAEGVGYGAAPPGVGWPDPSAAGAESSNADPGEDLDIEAEMARLAAIERGEVPAPRTARLS